MHDPVLVDPAACPDLATGNEPLQGLLLAWRWSDQEHGRWLALVRVRTPAALQHERWIGGALLRRADEGKHVGGGGAGLA